MADVHCPKCQTLVLRVRDGIGRVAKRSRSNMTWATGMQVSATSLLLCPICGADVSFVEDRLPPSTGIVPRTDLVHLAPTALALTDLPTGSPSAEPK